MVFSILPDASKHASSYLAVERHVRQPTAKLLIPLARIASGLALCRTILTSSSDRTRRRFFTPLSLNCSQAFLLLRHGKSWRRSRSTSETRWKSKHTAIWAFGLLELVTVWSCAPLITAKGLGSNSGFSTCKGDNTLVSWKL